MRDDSGPPQEQDEAVSDEGRLTRTVAKWRCLTSSDHRRAGNWESALPEGCGGAGSWRYGWAGLTTGALVSVAMTTPPGGSPLPAKLERRVYFRWGV